MDNLFSKWGTFVIFSCICSAPITLKIPAFNIINGAIVEMV